MTVSSKRRPANGILTKRCPRGVFTTSHPQCWGETFHLFWRFVKATSRLYESTTAMWVVKQEMDQRHYFYAIITMYVSIHLIEHRAYSIPVATSMLFFMSYILQTSPQCVFPPASPRWRSWCSARTPPCEKTWPLCCRRHHLYCCLANLRVVIHPARGVPHPKGYPPRN